MVNGVIQGIDSRGSRRAPQFAGLATLAFLLRLLLGWRASKAASKANLAQGAISATDSMASSGAL